MTSLDNAIDILETLIAFDTVSKRSNLELIHYVEQYLETHGVESTLIYNEEQDKANLYATIGPTDTPGICLSGHSDVVPAQGQSWNYPAFELTRSGDRLYGRGTADMKSYLAVMLACLPLFIKHAKKIPFHFAISHDEEIGCVGVRSLIEYLDKQSIKPLGCIIGEPTNMELAVAHKGKQAWRVHVKGKAGHSALTQQGVNAVEYGARLISYITDQALQRQHDGPFDEQFIPPYSTIHTGLFNGGTALNIIPDKSALEFEIRNIPQEAPEHFFKQVKQHSDTHLLAQMHKIDEQSRIDFEETVNYPALTERADHLPFQQTIAQLLNSTKTKTISFGTEGGLFQSIGIPTVVCGPGSMDQGHKADEYIEISQIKQCIDFMTRLAEQSQDLFAPR